MNLYYNKQNSIPSVLLTVGKTDAAFELDLRGHFNLLTLQVINYNVKGIKLPKLSGLTVFQSGGSTFVDLTQLDVSGFNSIYQILIDRTDNIIVVGYGGQSSLASIDLNEVKIAGAYITTVESLLGNSSLLQVNFGGNNLSVLAVDTVLSDLDTNGLLNGTLNLSGGTNAAPTGGGANPNLLSLAGKGWVINVNP